ncbi:MAG TPA: hypothetical protein DEP84_18300, partial [Chloroflexi bacterium]|nr:hypothetical protein [Chloroflexota bacterium]
IDDLLAATRYLAARPQIDGRRLGLMGTSRGAYSGLLALTRASALWQAAVLNMGFYDPLTHVQHEHVTRPTTSPFTHFSGHSWEQVFAYYRDPSRNPLTRLRQVRTPLLVIHGDADPIIDVKQALMLLTAATAARVPITFQVIAGMDHDLEQTHPAWSALWAQIVAFFQKHLA